jgi:hypothetical protein
MSTEAVKTEPFNTQSNGKCRHITNKPEKGLQGGLLCLDVTGAGEALDL